MSLKHWVPALVVPAVVAGAIFVPMQAGAVDLPERTPLEVLELAQSSNVTEFSGVVVKTTDLGLPQMEFSSMVDQETVDQMTEKMPEEFADFVPQIIEQNPLNQAIGLIAGTHTFRVYASGELARVQVMDMMSQRDLVVGQNEIWMHDFRQATAYRMEIDRDAAEAKGLEAFAELEANPEFQELNAELQRLMADPSAVAKEVLDRVDESSEISVGINHRVAGRASYELRVTPDAAESLIDYISMSVDGETGMPLRVAVYSKELATPAASIEFESISFSAVDQALFSFTPPAGTVIVEAADLREALKSELPTSPEEPKQLDEDQLAELEALAKQYEPEVIGSDWSMVVIIPGGASQLPLEMLENELFADLMTSVEGGKAFSTPLMNVIITDSGDLVMGAVSLDYLVSVSR